MPLAADYPFLDFFWSMLLIFLWVAWIFVLFKCVFDIFRRHDISGWGKAAWTIFIVVVPFLGVLVYLIAQGGHMGERDLADAKARQSQFDEYVRQTAGGAGGASGEIVKAKELLDSGAITQAEFDAIKQKALA
jgi:Short C-terminal domain/Phospholipase_D-nuclease N-terminal